MFLLLLLQILEKAKVIEDKRKAEHAAAQAAAAAAAAAAKKAAPPAPAPKPSPGIQVVVFAPENLIYPQVGQAEHTAVMHTHLLDCVVRMHTN